MSNVFDLSGKRILLVGSTGVLGEVYARYFSENKVNAVIADRPGSGVLELAEELGLHGLEMDISIESSVRDGVKHAVSFLGGLDAAVNNAAVTFESFIGRGDAFAEFEDYPFEVWQKTIDVNLTGAFLFAREAGKVMKESGSGHLINVSSIYGVVGPDHRIYDEQPFSSMPGYSASKAGIIGLTRWLATWWAKDNIRANCISPGGVNNNHNKQFVKKYGDRTPMGRMAERHEMLGMMLFLLSDASSYCTGQNYIVDGGLTAW